MSDPIPCTRIAIAEDDHSMRDALGALIDAEDDFALVGSAADADEAIGVARDHRPDVFLLDVRMPGGGGVRAAGEIRRISPATRMVALSAHGDRETVARMLGAGAIGYVVKGSSADDVLAALRFASQGRRWLSPSVTSELSPANDSAAPETPTPNELREALESADLDLVYDPVWRMADSHIVCVEARPNTVNTHPLPHTGVEEADSMRLFRAAIETLSAAASQLLLSLPLSPSALLRDRFFEDFPEPALRVVVILNASLLGTAADGVDDVVAQLRRRGVRVAVSNVDGADADRMERLRVLHPDFINVTMPTAKGATGKGAQAPSFDITAFAVEIGALTVATGIDTDEQLAAAQSVGIPYGQGRALGWSGAPFRPPVVRAETV